MDNLDDIKKEFESLPKGYISNKTIAGKVRHYLQWNENGKIKSKYIKDNEYEDVKAAIERRKVLAALLGRAAGRSIVRESNPYGIRVITGESLDHMVDPVKKLEMRDCFPDLKKFVNGPLTPKIMVIYGLRRTGKTTLLFQAINRMDTMTRQKAFYIKAQKGQKMSSLCEDLETLFKRGYRYAFIDEITFLEDFIDSAAVLADIYAAMGMKIVISGTDSLGLWLAGRNELYDRTYTIHTTYISFAEHARLLHTDDVDDYIRYGGTLRAGEYDFDDPELRDESVAFRDDESTRRYIDTAICRNIQHSLKCYESGTRFMHLRELYEADELTNAINRVIEDMNHSFVLSVLQNDFQSSDLRLAAKNLGKERDLSKRTNALEKVDAAAITARLMNILDIKNKEDIRTELRPEHVMEIKAYLTALDLIEKIPVKFAYGPDQENIAITQPGMRYCQAEALVWSLKKGELFRGLSEAEKDYIVGKILDEIRGRMLEEIIQSEMKRSLDARRYDVFKYQFVGGEIDMIIYDKEKNNCRLYEIKHSTAAAKDQCNHLLNGQECATISHLFGTIIEKAVIYRGETMQSEWGVSYYNAAEFLK